MYYMLTVEDTVRVLPSKLGLDLHLAARESLQEQIEGSIDSETGIIVAVSEVENVGEGRIIPGDGAIYYPVVFKVLTFYPNMYEVVEGEIIDVTEFGAFLRMGPFDGLIHISQVMDDFVSYDSKNSIFSGKESKRTLKEGDISRARVITVSIGKSEYKIGMTMRQSGLGTMNWLKQEIKKKNEEDKKAEAREASKKK